MAGEAVELGAVALEPFLGSCVLDEIMLASIYISMFDEGEGECIVAEEGLNNRGLHESLWHTRNAACS